MSKKIYIFLAISIFMFSCKTKKKATNEATKVESVEVKNSKVEIDLAMIVGDYYISSIEVLPEFNGIAPTIEIDELGKISGFNGCNSFFGKLNFEGGNLIDNLGATRMACEGEANEVEMILMQVLKNVTDIKREGNVVRFFSEGKAVITGKDISLEEGVWQIESVNGKYFEEQPTFEVMNSRMNGNTGCNSFFGMVDQNRFKLKFIEVGATEMDCANIDMSMEAMLFKALSEVTEFKRIDEMAIFYNNEKELFRATKPE